MPDYSKGKIYKIVCNTTGLVYIGSTCEPTLARRLVGHRRLYNAYLNGKTKSTMTSFKVLESNNYEIILMEIVNCLSKDELHARERYNIKSIECVNKNIPTRTKQEHKELKKEYYQDNKEHIKEYEKDYYEANKDNKKTYNQAYYQEKKDKAKQLLVQDLI